MNLWRLAKRNVQGNLRDYQAYLVSSMCTVLLFFLYASILFHSDWLEEQDTLWLGAMAVLLVILLFSALFIGYSHRIFVQARLQEWALLRVMGADERKITMIVGFENGLIGTVTILVGIGLGSVFSKLFILTVSMVLELREPLTLPFSSGAAILTVAVFGFIFLVHSLLTPMYLMRMTVVDLLQLPSRVSRRFTRLGWSLGIFILLVSYIFIWFNVGIPSLTGFLVIGVLMCGGMYLLLYHGGSAWIEFLKKKSGVRYRACWFLTFSLLGDHWRDRTPLLVMAVILNFLVLGSIHLYFNFYTTAEYEAINQNPFSISFIEAPGDKVADTIGKLIKEHGLHISVREEVRALKASLSQQEGEQVAIVSLSDFNRLLKCFDRHPPVQVSKGEALYVFPYGSLGGQPEHTIDLYLGKEKMRLPLRDRYTVRVFNEHRFTERVVILDDQRFNRLFDQYGNEAGKLIHGWVLSDWQESGPAVKEMKDKWTTDSFPDTSVEAWKSFKQLFSTLYFSSLFIGVLLFLSAGSLLYFNIITGCRRDAEKLKILHGMGLTLQEWGRAVKLYIRLIFLLPLVVAMGHHFFFLNKIPFFTSSPDWRYLGVAYILYIVGYGIYIRITEKAYLFRTKTDYYNWKSDI